MKLNKISELLEADALFNKFLIVMTPFRVIIGLIFLFLSLLIFISLVITSLDRVTYFLNQYINSKCGMNCGFILDNKNYTNYLDFILLYFSRHFHFDHLLFAVVNIYVFICSIYGFVKLGIKMLCFTVFIIKIKFTSGLLLKKKTLIHKGYLLCLLLCV